MNRDSKTSTLFLFTDKVWQIISISAFLLQELFKKFRKIFFVAIKNHCNKCFLKGQVNPLTSMRKSHFIAQFFAYLMMESLNDHQKLFLGEHVLNHSLLKTYDMTLQKWATLPMTFKIKSPDTTYQKKCQRASPLEWVKFSQAKTVI